MNFPPAAESEVLAVVSERDKAFLAADVDKVASFMADEYLQTDVNGRVQDKKAWLDVDGSRAGA